MASLNLPAGLEDVGGQKVPQSVLEKSQQIKDMGGLTYLDKLIADLPELLTRNREILNEVRGSEGGREKEREQTNSFLKCE